MKMIMAVVSGDDSNAVSAALTKARFSVTKLATTGGFLMSGNTTFLIGVDDDKVSEVIDIIAKHSKKRKISGSQRLTTVSTSLCPKDRRRSYRPTQRPTARA